ncbi:MAG: (d)CMP kinase [Thermodesulfovibrio sp.]|nr:(d)CMP kinase [Thermodesulfovibrio sp.]
MPKVIAIDGPSGAGKSTISKLIAEKLGFQFLDTGALYRAAALHLTRKGIKPESSDNEIINALKDVVIALNGEKVFLNGGDVSEAVRTTEAGHYASIFSAKKAVRDFLLQVQRDAARYNDIVAEGRDMTTVVFPDASKKFYLDASVEVRARRRYLQLKEKGMEITMDEALRDVMERDERDSKRDISPLRKADDAVYINTTGLTLNDAIKRVLREMP